MDLVVAFVGAVVPTLGGLFLYLRHRDKLRFYRHVYDEGGAEDTAKVALALSGKTPLELEQDPRADGPGAARARRTGRRRRRRQKRGRRPPDQDP